MVFSQLITFKNTKIVGRQSNAPLRRRKKGCADSRKCDSPDSIFTLMIAINNSAEDYPDMAADSPDMTG